MIEVPRSMSANGTASALFLAAMATFFAASVLWAFRQHRRVVLWVAPLALAGGIIASLEEAWIDGQILLWYPTDAPAILYTAHGTPQPLYLHLAYAGFVGLGAYVVYRGLVTHEDGRHLWPTFWSICALDLAFELPATLSDVYHYYGPQPFQITDSSWPFWVAPINAAGPVLGGYLMYRLIPLLRGWERVVIALLPPLAYAGAYGATVWPTTTAMKSDLAAVWVWGAAVVTMSFCLAIVLLINVSLRVGTAARRTETGLAPSLT